MTHGGANGAQLGVEVALRLPFTRLTQGAMNSRRHRLPVPARDLVKLSPLVWVEQHVETLTHVSLNY
jgi:hypothetical protein